MERTIPQGVVLFYLIGNIDAKESTKKHLQKEFGDVTLKKAHRKTRV